MDLNRNDIKDAIAQSQHCQRNWDLSKQIPEEDIDTIISAVTQCPSKQNVAYYNVHVITNRTIIESIYEQTQGFIIRTDPYQDENNSQVLANLLLVFEEVNIYDNIDPSRNDQIRLISLGQHNSEVNEIVKRDRYMSIGIASGYANLIANMMGYHTGYCACFDGANVKQILGTLNNISLMLGIGYNNVGVDRKIHHSKRYVYPTMKKQEIKIINHR